jgi:hypothetical protein
MIVAPVGDLVERITRRSTVRDVYLIHDISDPDEIVVRISQAGGRTCAEAALSLSEALRMCA